MKLKLAVVLLLCAAAFPLLAHADPSVIASPSATVNIVTSTAAASLKNERQGWQVRSINLRGEVNRLLDIKRQDFKQKLILIQDSRKQAKADLIDNKIINVNRQRTDEMSQALVQLNGVLEKLVVKTGTAKDAGKNVTAAEETYLNARAAVDAAEDAVAAQTLKTYSADITGTATLKAAFGQTVSEFENDLRVVHQRMVVAKQAVMQAAKEVALLNGTGKKVTPAP